jgi:3-dehydroquinate dehydratase II
MGSVKREAIMAEILVLSGPNLNLLGKREPEIYGSKTYQDIIDALQALAKTLGHNLRHKQSQSEETLILTLQDCLKTPTDFILTNFAAFTHTSIALRDTLLSIDIPFIELHLSQPAKREAFRQTSYFADIAVGTLCGFGAHSYLLALHAAHYYLTEKS